MHQPTNPTSCNPHLLFLNAITVFFANIHILSNIFSLYQINRYRELLVHKKKFISFFQVEIIDARHQLPCSAYTPITPDTVTAHCLPITIAAQCVANNLRHVHIPLLPHLPPHLHSAVLCSLQFLCC